MWVFPHVAGHLKRALERGSNYTVDSVLAGLLQGHLQLWTYGTQAGLVTSLQDSECLLLCCGGYRMKEWIHCLELIGPWAKAQDCEYLRIQGRKGWARFGFEIEGKDNLGLTIMRKHL